METFSALLAICAGNSPVHGEFPAQRPVARSFDVFFDLRLNKRLSKQSWGWWFETILRLLWRHRNDLAHWPLRCGNDFKSISFKLVIQNSSLGARWGIALKWISRTLMGATLVQVMTSCHLACCLLGPRSSLRWRHNERDSVSNDQPHDCLLNRLFRRRS